MMRSLVWHGRISTTGSHVAPISTHSHHIMMPAIVLAFLLAITISAVAFNQSHRSLRLQGLGQSIETNANSDTASGSNVPDAEGVSLQAVKQESAQPTSIKAKTTIDNGHVSTELNVNGQKLPVTDNAITHQTVTNESNHTTIDLQVTNNQAANSSTINGFNSTNSSVSSSSNSFQYINH